MSRLSEDPCRDSACAEPWVLCGSVKQRNLDFCVLGRGKPKKVHVSIA